MALNEFIGLRLEADYAERKENIKSLNTLETKRTQCFNNRGQENNCFVHLFILRTNCNLYNAPPRLGNLRHLLRFLSLSITH